MKYQVDEPEYIIDTVNKNNEKWEIAGGEKKMP